jgi:hypothetical protein
MVKSAPAEKAAAKQVLATSADAAQVQAMLKKNYTEAVPREMNNFQAKSALMNSPNSVVSEVLASATWNCAAASPATIASFKTKVNDPAGSRALQFS